MGQEIIDGDIRNKHKGGPGDNRWGCKKRTIKVCQEIIDGDVRN